MATYSAVVVGSSDAVVCHLMHAACKEYEEVSHTVGVCYMQA